MPEAQIRCPRTFFDAARGEVVDGPMLARMMHSLHDIRTPEAQAVAPVRAQNEPAIEQYEIVHALALARRRAKSSVVQVEQEELGFGAIADENVARVRVWMHQTGMVRAGHEAPQRLGQRESRASTERLFQSLA